MKYLIVNTGPGESLVDITRRVQETIAQSAVAEGLCYLFVPHSQAGIAICGLDPARDGPGGAPRSAHALTLLVVNRRLGLTRGQGVYFVEKSGPQRRKVLVKVVDGIP